jgi:hypothetical protein
MIEPRKRLRPKGKTAVALPGNTTAFQETQYANGISATPDPASGRERLISALADGCTRLGRRLTCLDGNLFCISGMSRELDLRAAAIVVRQLEGGRA